MKRIAIDMDDVLAKTTHVIIDKINEITSSSYTYEELLKASGIGMKLAKMSPDELKKAGELMGQARKATDTKYKEALKNANNILIDSVGGSSKTLLKKKQELEDLGYSTAMIMAYVSPITSLERNKQRDRSLLPSIVLRSWRDVNKNIDVLFLCLGHGNSKKFLENNLFSNNTKIIDLSNDFRLNKDAVFQGNEYVYGLPELQQQKIEKSNYIANPGCFFMMLCISA